MKTIEKAESELEVGDQASTIEALKSHNVELMDKLIAQTANFKQIISESVIQKFADEVANRQAEIDKVKIERDAWRQRSDRATRCLVEVRAALGNHCVLCHENLREQVAALLGDGATDSSGKTRSQE